MLVINDGNLESWVLSCAGMRRVSNAGFCQRYHNGVGCKFQFQYQEAGHHRRVKATLEEACPNTVSCAHIMAGRPWSSGLCCWSPNHHSFREEGFDFRKHLGSIRKSPATEYQHGPIHELVCYLRHESSWECCHHGFVHFAHQFFTTSGGPCFLAGWWTDARFSIRELQLCWKYVVNQC